MDNLNDAMIGANASIKDAMMSIGKSRQHICLIVDGDNRLLGTVTDGDIRRAILRSTPLEAAVHTIMNDNPVTASPETDGPSRIRIMREHKILQLPVIDADDRLVDLAQIDSLVSADENEKPNWVVLMAGGLGSRLLPLTEELPKPLLPVSGKPILETIIEILREHGFRHFYISVNYKANLVREYFGDGAALGIEIRYLNETDRLGTAGSLGLITERHDAPLLVMNGDLLTKVDFRNLLTYHREHNADATVCVREIGLQVPFGVVQLDRAQVSGIVEKPVHQFMVNAGIYVLEPSAVETVEKDAPLDMPDFLRNLIQRKKQVVAFPIHEYWIDVGRVDDLNQAAVEFKRIFS